LREVASPSQLEKIFKSSSLAAFTRINFVSGFLNFLIGFDQLSKLHMIQRSLDKETIGPILGSSFPIFWFIIA
jgi:hypothetical protein